jgi:hypothetical protein
VTETFVSAVALGKRRREADQPLGDGGTASTHSEEMPPHKRARGGRADRGILKGKTRRKPAARILKQQIDCKPEEAGRGAERLATPSSQGIYYQSLPGPSFQQGWSADAADGTPTRVEGRVDEEVAHHTDKTVQQRNEKAGLFYIPRIFRPEQWLLLQTTEADIARGAVEAIKCRLCPKAQLKNFEEFKRHCRTSETHPWAPLDFCKRCGDFFARPDSLKRHVANPPPECRRVTPVMAAEKHERTLREHDAFVQRMGDALREGQGIPEGFAVMMKKIYPESSKKRTSDRK